MKLDLRTKVALVINFTDSIGEGYAYYDRDFANKSGGPDFEKLEIVGVASGVNVPSCGPVYRLDDEYLEVADKILSMVRAELEAAKS